MRFLQRKALAPATEAFLSERTAEVKRRRTPRTKKEHAAKLWGQRRSKEAAAAFKDVQKKLASMGSGLERCMYCEDSKGTDIEHFWPKAAYPERAFLWANYLWACSHCNSNEKREQFPLDAKNQPLLINPTEDDPLNHLLLITETGDFDGLSEKGIESMRVFGLNRRELSHGRQNAWPVLLELILRFAQRRAVGDRAKAEKIEQAVRQYPFSSVLHHLLDVYGRESTRGNLGADIVEALDAYPEILSWGR
jgi:uncharacterized protein (TIGR02646 family)